MGYGVGCCLPEGCVRFTFSQLPMTTSSLFLPARVSLRVSALHPRRDSRIPSEGGRNDTPLLPSSPFYFLGFFACPRRRSFRLLSRRSLSSCRWDRKNSTGLTEDNIPGKRAEGVIIPTKHPPRLAQSLLGVWALLISRSSTFPGLLEAIWICRISWIHREPVVCVCARARVFVCLALR